MFLQCLSADSQKTPTRRIHVSLSAVLQKHFRIVECLFFWLLKRYILQSGLSVYKTRTFTPTSLFLAPWKPFSGRSCPKRHYMTDMSKVRVQTTTHLFFCLFGEDSSNIRSAGLDPGHVLTACALHGSYITQTSKLAVGVSMPRVFFSA